MNTINTSDIVKMISDKTKDSEGKALTQNDVKRVIDLFKEVILESLTAGNQIRVTGLFNLSLAYRSARKGNNVITGEPIDIPECITVSAKVASDLKKAVHDLDKSVVLGK